MGTKVRPQDLRAKDTRNLLLTIFSQWLPLAPSAFKAIVDKIPNPALAQSFRIPRMLHPELGHLEESIEPKNRLEKDLYEGSLEEDSFQVAYVSKMFAVRKEDLPENQRKALTAEDLRRRAREVKEAREKRLREGGATVIDSDGVARDSLTPTEEKEEQQQPPGEVEDGEGGEDSNRDALIGFARLYSGTISLGQSLYAVLPKYNSDLPPSHPQNVKHLSTIKVEQLYMMMGRELLAVKEVQAGNLFAIGGLEGIVLRNATLCGIGKGKSTQQGKEVDQDRDCLVNLAGVTQNVNISLSLSFSLFGAVMADLCSLSTSIVCSYRSCSSRTSRSLFVFLSLSQYLLSFHSSK